MVFLTVAYVAFAMGCIISIFLSWTKIEPDCYLVITRTFLLLPTPGEGHFIARGFQQGIKARAYTGAGWHFIPFVNIFAETAQYPLVEVPDGKFGKIEALDGEPLQVGQVVAEHVVECANFTDGDAFLAGGGQRGVQIPLLPPGKWPINQMLFRKTDIDLIVIPDSMIGLVTLKIGNEIPEESHRNLGVHVDGHNNFQNITSFLDLLEKGVQLDVLEPGSYSLNNSVVTTKNIDVGRIEKGEVGVVISSVGEEPIEEDLDPVEIDGRGRVGAILKQGIGKRGILPIVIDPGLVPYTFSNTIAYKIEKVRTAPIAIDWIEPDESKKHEHPAGMSLRFDPIDVVTSDGFTIPVEAELIVSVSRKDAPRIVAMGGMEEVVSNLIVPVFDDLAKTIISERQLIDLIKERKAIRDQIQGEVKNAIQNDYKMTVIKFRISEFDFENSPDPEVAEFINFIAKSAMAEQEVKLIEKQKLVEKARVMLENIRAQADNQNILVKAGFQRQASDDQSVAIKNRGENLKGLESVQALIADPEAIPGLVSLLSSLLPKKTGVKD